VVAVSLPPVRVGIFVRYTTTRIIPPIPLVKPTKSHLTMLMWNELTPV
jgi:hypothetical protein